MKIAVPIIARNMEEALYDIERASGVADILELRIDYMKRPDLKRLLSSSPLPKIVTNRVAGEGGEFHGSEDERFAYLEEAADLGAEYVDVELNCFRRIPRKSTKLIVSHHLGRTPDDLQEIYRNIVDSGADVVKIATMANSYQDSVRMLNLILQASSEGKDIIGICMGEKGIITRIYGPAFGGYLTFASLSDDKKSAPGQITAEELRRMWTLLKLNG
ncbi:MAG: type I 3-dehydroquinate dehydratase [Candidatus Aenigmarchaeota archaeon]|nr:type I 3-dehydroquinate dehydratase [Candidatus Aenigmarchaeota archaeon]